MPAELLAAAREYLEKGWRVVPTVKKASIVPFIELRTLDAQDPIFIQNFEDHLEATGIALILPLNYGILDLDSSRAEEEFKDIIKGATGIKTSRGSKYLFNFGFLPNCPAKFHIREDVEIILEGMLCELPPGLHKDGITRYEWVENSEGLKFVQAPKALHIEILQYLAKRSEGKGFAAGELEELMHGIAAGEGRNEAAIRIAGHLIGKGNTWETIETTLEGWNRKNKPPMSHRELEGVLKSARKMYDEKQESEAKKKQAEKYRKNSIKSTIQGTLSNPLQIAQALQEQHPLYFDPSRNFWMWNSETCSYERVDETELFCAISEAFACTIYNSKTKSEVLEALKITGRQRRVKPTKKSWIQFLGEVFDINTGETFEATPEYFFASPIPHRIGYSEETPNIDKLFNDWLNEKSALLYEICAYCLLDDYPIQRLFAFIGSGSNGKGQFMTLLRHLIGNDNCVGTDLERLAQSRFEASKLYHKKAAFIGETNYTTLTKTNMLKQLTGGDYVSGEFKGRDPFDFVNTAKIIIASNGLPKTADMSDGFYRRWCHVEFKNKFKDGKSIVDQIQEEEYENLCKKCLRILQEILNLGGLPHEDPLEARKSKYEALSNPVQSFIDDECETDTEESTPLWYLYDIYDEYRERKGHRRITKDDFSKTLKSMGFESKLEWFTPEMQQKYKETPSEGRAHWSSIECINIKEFGQSYAANEFKKECLVDMNKTSIGQTETNTESKIGMSTDNDISLLVKPEVYLEYYKENRVKTALTALTNKEVNKEPETPLILKSASISGLTKPSSLVTAAEMLEAWKREGVL